MTSDAGPDTPPQAAPSAGPPPPAGAPAILRRRIPHMQEAGLVLVTALLDRLARAGLGILLISSELPEVLNLSDRILVMREGRLAGELRRDQADQASLLRLMAGVAPA